MRKPELLVPASSLEVLKIATIFGADAVYIGGEAFGLRAKARNFTKEEMAQGIAFAHEHGVKVYVTVNILAHNYDLAGVREYLAELKELAPDALIIADPGIFTYAKEIVNGESYIQLSSEEKEALEQAKTVEEEIQDMTKEAEFEDADGNLNFDA